LHSTSSRDNSGRVAEAGRTGGKPKARTRAGSPNELIRVIPAAAIVKATMPYAW
jgi:hypothetical protein